jgi:hypothetical protein
MRPECMRAVATALGRPLTAVQARDIETRIVRAMRNLAKDDPVAWRAKPQTERLAEAGKLAAEELLGEAQLKQQRLALQTNALARLAQHKADQAARGITGLDSLDRLVAFNADGKSHGLSVESQAIAIERDSLRQMLDTLEASDPRFFGLFENHQGIRDLTREIHGEDSGNPIAKAGAKVWKEITTGNRERFNRAGGDVGLLDDWGMPHHHSQRKVRKAGRDAWVAEILPRLKREKYVNEDGSRMSDPQLVEFLGEAYKTISTGGANKMQPGQPKGSGMRANRGNATRQIHFKSADDYLAYQGRFGDRTLYEVMVGHISGIAKDIALVETFGPNPDHTFRFLRDQAVQEMKADEANEVGDVDNAAINAENLYNIVAGKALPVASKRLAESFDTLRNWLVASRLGSAVITSFSDDATLHLTGHLNNLPAMQLFRNELAALNPANRMEKRMALRAGLAMNTLISSLNRFGQEGLGRSFSSKLANTTLRASGLNALTEARRRAFGVTMMSSLGSVVREHATLSAIDAADNRILLSKGITEADFAVWKAAKPEDWGGGNDTMLTPDAIYRVPDSAIAHLGDPTKLREQAATRLLGAVLEETNMAVIEPGVRERALTGAGMQRGTWKGELVRSVFLFKSFPLAMIARHWKRGMSMPNRGGRAAYLGTLLAATTVLGMASLQVNELLQGRDPRRMVGDGAGRNWLAAMLKGGSLGLYGDFLFSENTQQGRGQIASLAGPVAGNVEEILKLTVGNAHEAARGDKTHFGAEAVKFVRGNLPGANLWYTKAALDHLVFHQLQEYFSPGYLSKMRQRAQREFDQSFWWEPGETLPGRGPNLGAVAE